MSEQLSALMDGELDAEDSGFELTRLRGEAARRTWHDYHLIGDALRGDAQLACDLTARVMEALIDEPVVLAPPRRSLERQGMLQRSLAVAASVAGVAVVTALAWSGRPAAVAQQVAAVQGSAGAATVPAAAQVPPQLASVDLQAYLVAHQTHAPSAQGAAHYIKTVSMEAGVR